MAAHHTPGTVLTRLMDAIDPRQHEGDGAFVPDSALHAVGQLIGCDDITFQVTDVRTLRTDLQTFGSEVARDAEPLFRAAFWSSSCSYPQRSGDYQTVTRRSDFHSVREFAATAMGAYVAQTGFAHETMVPLPPDGALDRRLLLFRCDGPDFSDADVLTLSILRPHVLALHLRQRRRHAGVPDLTSRQMQILTMVAAGCSNAQVARALSVSPATVAKHLDHIYQRLDVNSRTAAVAKVLQFTAPSSGVLTG